MGVGYMKRYMMVFDLVYRLWTVVPEVGLVYMEVYPALFVSVYPTGSAPTGSALTGSAPTGISPHWIGS